MNPKDRENIMQHWDRWRKYIAEGGGGSWPRDAFESLLDYFFMEKYSIGDQVIDEDGCKGYVCIRYDDGDICFWENDAAHPNPVIVENIKP